MKANDNVLEYDDKTPRASHVTHKAATTAKKRIENSESQTPGLKQMKMQGL